MVAPIEGSLLKIARTVCLGRMNLPTQSLTIDTATTPQACFSENEVTVQIASRMLDARASASSRDPAGQVIPSPLPGVPSALSG